MRLPRRSRVGALPAMEPSPPLSPVLRGSLSSRPASGPLTLSVEPTGPGGEEITRADLTRWFSPFLSHFVEEARAASGEVWVARRERELEGVMLYNARERVGSAFAREAEVASELWRQRPGSACFSEFPLSAQAEPFDLFYRDLRDWKPPAQPRHPTRQARPDDREQVLALLRRLYGPLDEAWMPRIPHPREACWVVETEGQLLGAAWVAAVQGHGRLHALSVHPRFRHLGIARDLWNARAEWAYRAGASDLLAEIARENEASRQLALAQGMRAVGTMYLDPPAEPLLVGPPPGTV